MTVDVESKSVADTMAIGRRLAGLLRAGDVVILAGELGAGKTAFVGGVAEGLGIADPVTSPSFVIVQRYDHGFLPLIHADAYRLGTLGEFDDLDLWEEARDGVAIIEWGDAVAEALPDDHLLVRLEVVSNDQRLVRFVPTGSWVGRPLDEVQG